MCAGKTTAAKILKKTFKNILYHPEINQYTLMNKNHVGGAFVGRAIEKKINKASFKRLKAIIEDGRDMFNLIETDIFHCVFAKLLGEKQMAEENERKYQEFYQKTNAGIFFINTKPQISWARRRNYYLKRALKTIKDQKLKGVQAKKRREEMMKKYKECIFNLYSLWSEMYDRLSYPKIKIPNNGQSLRIFEKKVVNGFSKLTKKMKISVKA